eukprot:1561034-Alexandrium_andersonii.AAC.1
MCKLGVQATRANYVCELSENATCGDLRVESYVCKIAVQAKLAGPVSRRSCVDKPVVVVRVLHGWALRLTLNAQAE